MSATAWPQTNTSVERLTVRYQGTAGEMNAAALRLRVERLLETAELQPPGLPSGAVFIVRKLEGPAPLSIAALAHSSPPAWREGVRSQVQALYAAAARPSNGPISADAASILFNDAGELLACLTRDLLAGDARQRWYWQRFLRGIPHQVGAALATLWSNQTSAVPTVLALLSISEATGAITLLSPGEVFSVTRALHASFDLPSQALDALRNAVPDAQYASQVASSNWADASRPLSELRAGEPRQAGERRETSLYPAVVPPPWRLANACTASLTPQALYLLGLGLSLYHAPAYARSTAFAQRTVSWFHALTTPLEPPATPPRASQVRGIRSDEREGRSIHDTAVDGTAPARALTEVTPEESGTDVSRHNTPGVVLTAPTGTRTGEYERRTSYDTAVDDSPSAHALTKALPAESGADLRRGVLLGEGRSYHETAGDSRQPPPDGWPTALGGILYLLHLLTWLNLPGGWDDEGTFAEGMSGWAIVEALAGGLSGTWLASSVDDPVWRLLAILDGREPGEPLGAGLPRQTAFRLPAPWLLHFAPARPTWLATVDDGRLRIIDVAGGYLVVDVPCSEQSPEEVALAEVETYRSRGIDVRWQVGHLNETGEAAPPGPLAPVIQASMSESAAWWLERVLGFLRYFMASRLGTFLYDAGQIAPALFERSGQLIAGRTHVDLHMAMDQISLPIRRAGFDRDPGWMPDLGRIVLFHFD